MCLEFRVFDWIFVPAQKNESGNENLRGSWVGARGRRASLTTPIAAALRRCLRSAALSCSVRAQSRAMASSIDIGANLLDGMFQGVYHGKAKHAPDLDRVLSRARSAGLEAVMVTAGNLDESAKALDLARRLNSGGGDDAKSDGGKLDKSSESKRSSERDRPRFLFSTVGVHPTRCLELEKGGDAYLRRLLDLALEGKKSGEVVAIGECGLDYDRLKFCPKDVQLVQFEKQFELAEATGLPMFLHSRNAAADFSRLVRRNRNRFSTGVVHSFTGAWDEAEELIDMGLYIGINGCSLKTQENLDVVAKIPLDRLMVETDAPWCGIRRTHAGYEHVKTTWESVKKEKHVP